MVSGGFDPIHAGHIRLIQDARRYGDVIVALNSDAWLNRKKGFAFMSWEHRAEILRAIVGVKDVIAVDDADGTVRAAIRSNMPALFANGGDRAKGNTPEVLTCQELGVTLVWRVGGEKIQSSSELTSALPK